MLFRVLAINTIIFASAFVLPYNETLNEEAKNLSVRNAVQLKRGYCYDTGAHWSTIGQLPSSCIFETGHLVLSSPMPGSEQRLICRAGSSIVIAPDTCDPYQLLETFHIYTSPVGQFSIPFYRCYGPDGSHHIHTTDRFCENPNKYVEYLIGYVAKY